VQHSSGLEKGFTMAHMLQGTPPAASQMTNCRPYDGGDDSGVVSLLFSNLRLTGGVKRPFANSNDIGRPSFRYVSARVSAGIRIFRRAVRGRYRYAASSFVTAQQDIDQLRSMLVDLLGGARASRVCPRANKSWRTLEGGGAATDWGCFNRVYP
jgi:hypothetical protein